MANLVHERTHRLREPRLHLLTVHLRAWLQLRTGQHRMHQPELHLFIV
jgi:hypothetical protein